MNRKIELLAPAGNYEAFIAGVENGADAVYLGGKLLNARQFAGNFDDEELEKAIDYAHLRGVKVFLAMNTLVLDAEMYEAVEFAAKAYQMGVDAFIVQDLGLASSLKKAIPGIPLHASTQMTTYSAEGVEVLAKQGFERVVLARELQLDEIRAICKNTDLEIEVFVHGALCISYSGQCLMSSVIGGRSGNRGKCAQPCRLPYSMTKDNSHLKRSYILSPKDICYIQHISELIEAGVTSLKIEGRMKSPEYVATVVSTYRKYLDGLQQDGVGGSRTSENAPDRVSEEDLHRLLQSFNRGGFSKGYLYRKTGPEMMSYEKPKNWGTYLGTALAQDRSTSSVKLQLENTLGNGDGIEFWSGKLYEESPGGIITKIVRNGQLVKRANAGDTVWVSVIKGKVDNGSKVYKTSDKELLEQAAASYAKPMKKSDVKVAFAMKEGQLPVIEMGDTDGNSVTVQGEVLPEKALNKPLSEERISEQLMKLGATPFNVAKLEINIDHDLVIPISEINNIRRKATELLEKKKIMAFKRDCPGNISSINENSTVQIKLPSNQVKNAKISSMFYNLGKDIDLEKLASDRIYLPFNDILSPAIQQQTDIVRKNGIEVYAYIPSIIKGEQAEIIKRQASTITPKVDGFLTGNIGVTQLLRSILGDMVNIFGDYTLNVTNSAALDFFTTECYRGIMLSYEISAKHIASLNITSELQTEVGVYGRIPIMTSEYCPVGSVVGNSSPDKCKTICKSGVYNLKDRKNAAFPVKCDCIDCRSTIFNSDILFAPELVRSIAKAGVEFIRLSFVDESPEEIYDIVKLHRQLLEEGKSDSTQNSIIERIRHKGVTKGHLVTKGSF